MALTMAKAKETGEPILHLFATMPSIRFARDNKGTYNVYTLFRLLKNTVVVFKSKLLNVSDHPTL